MSGETVSTASGEVMTLRGLVGRKVIIQMFLPSNGSPHEISGEVAAVDGALIRIIDWDSDDPFASNLTAKTGRWVNTRSDYVLSIDECFLSGAG